MELFCRKFSLTHSPPQVEVMVKRSVSYPGPCKPLGFLHRNSLRQRLLPGLLRAKKHGKRFPSGKWNSADDVSLRSLGADPSRKLGRAGERDFSPRIAFKKTRRPLSDPATMSPGSTGVTKMGLVANETHEREKSAPPETKAGKNAERSELSMFGIFSKEDNGKRKRRESKFVQTQPLYQAYWMEYKEHGDGDAAAVVSMASAVSLACLFQSVKDGRPRPTCPRNDTASLWQELCEVKERGIPDQIDANQLLLQEVIFEVVTSEASYQRSLTVAVCHFQKSRKLSECLVSTAKHTLFSNLPQVRDVSERFLLDLEDCLEKDVFLREIGNLILQHCPDFRRVYVPYVTNQMYQEKLMQQLVRENARFLQVLHKLEEQSVCNRQPLKSFLVLPFQRITRLKILLENILKLAWDRPELANSVRNALAAVSQIVSGCNEGVRSMMQTEELVMLEKKVDFVNIKSVPLISRDRVLLQHGELTQTMVQEGGIGSRSRLSNKPIHLHVFSDLLLLSNKTEHGRFLVIDYASRGHVQADSLKVKALGLPNSTFLLRLCRNHAGTSHELVLKASNEEEKRTWISVITNNECADYLQNVGWRPLTHQDCCSGPE